MGTSYNPRIVTENLVFCVDAANIRSYPKTGTTLTDLKGGNNGTLTNMDAANFSSDNAGSLSFDGSNEYVVYSNCPQFDFSNAPFSACCWFRSTQNSSYRGICGKIQLGNGTGGWAFEFHNAKVTSWISNTLLSSPSSYNDGNWHFACITHEQPATGNRYIYVDGNLVASSTMPNHSYNFSNIDMWVGGWTGNTGYLFNGDISGLSLYNRALTSDEVRQNYLATKERYA